MPTYKTLGIILGKRDLLEADRIYTIYTQERGKIKVLSKGAKKASSKLAGHLEPLTKSNLMVARGKRYDRVAGAVNMESFARLKNDFEKTNVAHLIAAIVDHLTKEHHQDEPVFELLNKTLKLLNQTKKKDKGYFFILLTFCLKFLSLSGFRSELQQCSGCQQKIKPVDNYFSPKFGGVLCRGCSQKDANCWKISPQAIKVMRLMQESDLNVVKKVKLPRQISRELIETGERLLSYYLEKEINLKTFAIR